MTNEEQAQLNVGLENMQPDDYILLEKYMFEQRNDSFNNGMLGAGIAIVIGAICGKIWNKFH